MSETTIKIEKGISVANRKNRNGVAAYPFAQLEVGDSFFVLHKTLKSISGPLAYWRLKLRCRFAARSVTENGIAGVRIWRTK